MTKDNEPLSSLTHAIGALSSVAALVLLIVFSSIYSTALHIVSFSIFGASLVLLYATSALYHFVSSSHPAKKMLQKMDHGMIYFLIAGTYTPICLVALKGAFGWTLLSIIWGLAIASLVLRLTTNILKPWVSPVIYLLMGWFIAIALKPLIQVVPLEGISWLVIGGVFYTLGVVFYALDSKLPRSRWFGMHELFHLFVIAGSLSHFILMFKYLVFVF